MGSKIVFFVYWTKMVLSSRRKEALKYMLYNSTRAIRITIILPYMTFRSLKNGGSKIHFFRILIFELSYRGQTYGNFNSCINNDKIVLSESVFLLNF
jgi:hypothetical protein